MYDYSGRCHVCGAPLGANARYCSSCGTPRAEPPPAAEPFAGTPSAPVRLLSDEAPNQSQPDAAGFGTPGGSAPPPPYDAAPPSFPGTVRAAEVKRAPSSSPVVFEVLGGIFGIYGIGWLLAGKTATGLILLALSAGWLLIAGVAAAHTALITCCGSVPLSVVLAIISAVMLHNAMRRG
jgi:hypothetical protein